MKENYTLDLESLIDACIAELDAADSGCDRDVALLRKDLEHGNV